MRTDGKPAESQTRRDTVFDGGAGGLPLLTDPLPSAPLPASPRFGWASRWEELAIDYEALSADGSLPRE
jgi:hypothetical protein